MIWLTTCLKMAFKLANCVRNISLHPLAQYMTASDNYMNARALHEQGFFIGNHHIDFNDPIKKFVDLVTKFDC